MNNEEIFSIWAPETSPWSRWVKPVLFAHLEFAEMVVLNIEPPPDVAWTPSPAEKTALVFDLPGAEGVLAGIALAARGYRPVPLYNAMPLPFALPLAGLPSAAVDVMPIARALKEGAEPLSQLTLPDDASPAFLLDANRHGTGWRVQPGEFDNRSISFTTDFPSANFFTSQGIERILLVQRGRTEPQGDLAHSLRRWQDAQFILERRQIDSPAPNERFQIPRPLWYGAMFQRALAAFGFRRARWFGSGFGSWMPHPSSGG